MIRKAVDAALDQLVLRQEKEELTDMKQIKEEIFLEIAKRLEEEKIKRQNTVEVKSESKKNLTLSETENDITSTIFGGNPCKTLSKYLLLLEHQLD